jgi:NAD(P)-dependent dehydrogenase (short-subunit alcohol dehydrogenase family)
LRGLAGKIAIVTGGGQGIGRAIVLRLAEEGCKVALFDLKPEVAAETAKAAKGGQVRIYQSTLATALRLTPPSQRLQPSSAPCGSS